MSDGQARMNGTSTDDGNSEIQQPPTRSRPGTILLPNEYEWTNLPGWVTRHLRTQAPQTNADAFTALLELMKVPKAFWKGLQGRTLCVITDRMGFEVDLENVISFLGRNANAGEVRRSGLTEIGRVKGSDWVVFPASTLRKLQNKIQTDSGLRVAFEQLRRPEGGFCRMAVIGSWEDVVLPISAIASRVRVMSAEKVRFVELWQEGFLVTYTSQAAMDHPGQLEELLKRLEDLAFDAEDPETEPQTPFTPWMDLSTFHLLNPISLSNTNAPVEGRALDPFLARIRAVELIGRYQAWPKGRVNSLSAARALKQRTMSQYFCTNYFANPMTFRETWEASKHWDENGLECDPSTELKTLERESQRLGDQSWGLRKTLVIVSNREQRDSAFPTSVSSELLNLYDRVRNVNLMRVKFLLWTSF